MKHSSRRGNYDPFIRKRVAMGYNLPLTGQKGKKLKWKQVE